MAVTSIWPIKGKVENVIQYAANPEKTTEETAQAVSSLHAVDDVIEYAADQLKTEKLMYVSGIHCTLQNDFGAISFALLLQLTVTPDTIIITL